MAHKSLDDRFSITSRSRLSLTTAVYFHWSNIHNIFYSTRFIPNNLDEKLIDAFQINIHMRRSPLGRELRAHGNEPPHGQPLLSDVIFTQNDPDFSMDHEIKSSWCGGNVRIFKIASMSIVQKYCWSTCTFQAPFCSKKPDTLFSRHYRLRVIGWKGEPRGIHGSWHVRIFMPFPTLHSIPF